MAKLLPKHELFCQEYVAGGRGDLAYKAAYGNKSDNVLGASAARVLARDDVKSRVAELRAEVAKRNEITADSLMQDLERIYEIGIKLGKEGDTKGLSPAATAKHTQAKLGGFLIDKVQHSVEHMSDAELTKAIQGEQGNTVIPWAEVLRVSAAKG